MHGNRYYLLTCKYAGAQTNQGGLPIAPKGFFPDAQKAFLPDAGLGLQFSQGDGNNRSRGVDNQSGSGIMKKDGVSSKGSKPARSGEKQEENNLSKFEFNMYLCKAYGDPPANMVDPHAHHILFKEGNRESQKALVREGQALLRKYGIDPVFGIENLVWAPNRIKGQHDYAALKFVVDQLKEVDMYGGDYDVMRDMLIALGRKAARRRK